MSYGKTWDSRANKAARQQWVRGSNLENLIRFFEGVKFSLQTARDSALDEYAKLLVETQIAGPKKQFGNDEWMVYYNLNYECINQHLAQVRLSLNYKPPENAFRINGNEKATAVNNSAKTAIGTNSDSPKDDKQPFNDASSIKDITEREKFEKAKVAYEKGLEALRNALGTFDCGMDRAEFEDKFSLKWS